MSNRELSFIEDDDEDEAISYIIQAMAIGEGIVMCGQPLLCKG